MEQDKKTILYAANIDALHDPVLYQIAYERVGRQRKEKTDRLKVQKDKYLSLGTEILLQYALQERGYPVNISMTYGSNGKPYLKENPVSFNYSHSGDYALCAVSKDEVGCDIEKIGVCRLAVAKRFFTDEEYRRIASIAEPKEQQELFYRYWTLKESFLKVTGYGMKLPLNEFEIIFDDKIKVKHQLEAQNYQFAEFDVIAGYRCAVCIAGDCRETIFQQIDLRKILIR